MKRMKSESNVLLTRHTKTDEEAISRKMKLIQPKLFGLFTPVKYELISKKKVYVPYIFFVFSYHLRRGKKIDENLYRKSCFDKEGKIGIVFDLNEVHPFHFDLIDSVDLIKTEKKDIEGEIIPDQCDLKDAENQSMETIKWKLLRSVFHNFPSIEIESQLKFYRPAWELTVQSMGKSFKKYAYMDIYETENEHISGLKVRLDA